MDTAAVAAVPARMLLFLSLLGLPSGLGTRQRSCPAFCHCELDGMLLRVDCANLGLAGVPANLSVFTSYLDLSMNNISKLSLNSLHKLRFLEELRLAGNSLTYIPRGAFAGQFRLKILMLQNNLLRQVPSEALQNLHSLRSLRLDANHISFITPNCFSGLVSLRYLWLDDNSLTEIPVQAFRGLPALQAMTLALNKIYYIPDYAFRNLSNLVVLHLHNNRINFLGKKCFDGLHSLETLDLNYNNLNEFPTSINVLRNLKELGFHNNNIRSIPEQAFMGNPSLTAIHFYDNPIQIVGKSAFHHLPELRTLTLNGASEMTEFPDLTGTTSLESLILTGAQITTLPESICEHLPNLQVLDLSYNHLEELPCFTACEKLQKIALHHNEIYEIHVGTFQQLVALRSLDLAWNKISIIHANAFSSLLSLIKMDLSSNLLSSFPITGLHGLTHLKLTGNYPLQSLISSENFPELKVIEMPYPYQCCAFRAQDNYYKIQNQLNKAENGSADEFQKKDSSRFHTNDEYDFEDFSLDFNDDLKTHHLVRCSPSPGPFKPCVCLFGSWLIRVGVWTLILLAFICNILVIATIFQVPLFISSIKFIIGLIAIVNTLMVVSSSVLASVDALTSGVFAQYGTWWEDGIVCHIIGIISVFASEASIFLLTLATVERVFSVKYRTKFETKHTLTNIKIAIIFCFVLALIIAVIPMLSDSEYGGSPLCIPLPFGRPSGVGYTVAMVLMNSFCFLIMTVAYTKLYCNLDKGEMDSILDCSMIKHIALLLFINCILYCPVAILSFSSLLNLHFIGPEVIKPILLVIVPLPACLNPLLYILFNPHFRKDLRSFQKQSFGWKTSKHASLLSVNSEDAEKQSCNSTQALVTFASARISYDVVPSNPVVPSSCQLSESCNLSSITFVPCH
ncbi:leucine-rich repeat-containing G-protein coupled receptor 5 [Protobothrops mucrosquamatus]|uniref:leucine-rich repeat-containing G-protein coupled receptor 5 n=1 Tax=Protobothrops mucrosquamatus TaxID=103944 RepID=UPI000775809F|nr:leucine-rich repeat-containing G-protein coupled receptor 5 [Protobothrops mucrosquamatus]